MSIVNDGIVKVPSPSSPSADTYGEKGIEQGNDPGAPPHPTPSPLASNVIK